MTTLTQQLDPVVVHRPVLVSMPERLDAGCESALRRSALLKNLDHDVAQALAREFETFTAPRASILFAEDDTAEYLYIVLSGKVKLTQHATGGREKLVELLGPSDQFGEVSVLDSTPRTSTAVVVTDALLARLSKAALHEWIARHPPMATQLLRLVAQRLRRTHANLSTMVFVDTSGRVAKELLRLAQRFGVPFRDEIRIEHDLSQTELAQLVGASRETINKILSNYTSRGWIRLETKCIVILDRERLAQRAHPQPLPTHAIPSYHPY
ncbi:MAG TPA: Crp/Fnr family transcriptional regulator [Jatrophihabitantaceae bacterium]|jgi:CRP-like cAMP-binding protein